MALFQTSRRVLAPVPLRLSRFCATTAPQQRLRMQSRPDPARSFSSRMQTTEASDRHQVITFVQKDAATKLALGPENAMKDVPQQGWQYDTRVAESKIPGSGNGRYAAEPVKAGKDVIVKLLVPMSKIDNLASLPNDVTITFSTVADLEKYIDMAKIEGGHSREAILDYYEHFMYGFDGKVSCLNVSTWTVNHGDNVADGLNIEVHERTLPGGATCLAGEAMQDIQVNDEFYMDYRRFKLPEFYLNYTKEHGFNDVRTTVVNAVYGGNA